jgi:hypothetical protein
MRNRLGGSPVEALAPVMDHARGLVSRMPGILQRMYEMTLRGVAWWRVEIRRSRAVQYATVVVVIAIIILITWFFQHRPSRPSTPWQKLQRKFGL